jgi:hypothetical protein
MSGQDQVAGLSEATESGTKPSEPPVVNLPGLEAGPRPERKRRARAVDMPEGFSARLLSYEEIQETFGVAFQQVSVLAPSNRKGETVLVSLGVFVEVGDEDILVAACRPAIRRQADGSLTMPIFGTVNDRRNYTNGFRDGVKASRTAICKAGDYATFVDGVHGQSGLVSTSSRTPRGYRDIAGPVRDAIWNFFQTHEEDLTAAANHAFAEHDAGVEDNTPPPSAPPAG